MMTNERDKDTEQNNAGRDIRFLNDEKKKKKSGSTFKLLAVLTLAIGLAYAWWYHRAVETGFFTNITDQATVVPAEQVQSLLVDRLWIDELPQRESDKFNFYVFSGEDEFGINDKAQSIYKHLLEIFNFRADAKNINFTFPHDRRNARSAYQVEKLARPRGDIDMKLVISADPQMGGKSWTYWSSTKWQSHDLQSLPPMLRHLPLGAR
jgi:hypothetical protein